MNSHELITPLHLDSLNIEMMCNYVLVEYTPGDTSKTVSGIIVPIDSLDEADHISRTGFVVKVPKYLDYFKPKKEFKYLSQYEQNRFMGSMNWKTDIDVQVGDEVCFNFQESINAYTYKFEDRYFKSIHYQDIIAAKRGDEYIMCNGYVLLEEMTETEEILGYSKENIIQGKGVIAYSGTPNHEYKIQERQYGKYAYRSDPKTPLKNGDIAVILKEHYNKARYLEDATHSKFIPGKKLIVVQRYMIGAYIEN